MRLVAVIAASLAASILAACGGSTASSGSSPASASSKDGDTSGTTPIDPPHGGDTTPVCDSQCCAQPRPVEGATCATNGQSCPDVEWCPSGLVTDDRVLSCQGGHWVASGGSCPADGTVDSRGCPGAQPADGSACAAAEGTSCHYALDCVIGSCPDAGSSSGGNKGEGCVPAHHVSHEDATCSGGKWSTKPLGVCPAP